jgi:hypothetical protein
MDSERAPRRDAMMPNQNGSIGKIFGAADGSAIGTLLLNFDVPP